MNATLELSSLHGSDSERAPALDIKRAASGTPTVQLDLARTNQRLENRTGAEIVRWARETFHDTARAPDASPLIMTSSFGAHSAVMLHLVATHAPGTPVVFLDTGYLFPETYGFVEELKQHLNLELRTYSAKLTAARQEALHGKLWEQGEEGVRHYLQINKTEPMQRALAELKPVAWLAGLRADQTTHRANLETVVTQDGCYKVHPLLHWRSEDVNAYLEEHNLPAHPLVSQGYRSIGDVHSTLPTVPGQHPREGRTLGKLQECGIHLTAEENRSLTSSNL